MPPPERQSTTKKTTNDDAKPWSFFAGSCYPSTENYFRPTDAYNEAHQRAWQTTRSTLFDDDPRQSSRVDDQGIFRPVRVAAETPPSYFLAPATSTGSCNSVTPTRRPPLVGVARSEADLDEG